MNLHDRAWALKAAAVYNFHGFSHHFPLFHLLSLIRFFPVLFLEITVMHGLIEGNTAFQNLHIFKSIL